MDKKAVILITRKHAKQFNNLRKRGEIHGIYPW